MKHREQNRAGFTLLEIIIAMALSAVVLGFVGLLEDQLSRVASFINQELTNQQGLEQVFQSLVTEIRSMGPSSLGDYPLSLASSTAVTFYSDMDEDGLYERIRYYFTTSSLMKAVIKPTGNPLVYATSTETVRTLVQNMLVASSSFTYYDTNYTGAENPMAQPVDAQSVRIVRIDLYADISPSTAPQPTYFTNTITVRNLRSN